MATIGDLKCSHGQDIKKVDIVPYVEVPAKSEGEPEEPGKRLFWLIFIGLALVSAVFSFTMSKVQEKRLRDSARKYSGPVSPGPVSPVFAFTKEDVNVHKSWTLLAGNHPTVRFTCRLRSHEPSAKVVYLVYRPAGSGTWSTVAVRPNRERTCRVTLRDLYRDMPYECFFMAEIDGLPAMSEVVRFRT